MKMKMKMKRPFLSFLFFSFSFPSHPPSFHPSLPPPHPIPLYPLIPPPLPIQFRTPPPTPPTPGPLSTIIRLSPIIHSPAAIKGFFVPIDIRHGGFDADIEDAGRGVFDAFV